MRNTVDTTNPASPHYTAIPYFPGIRFLGSCRILGGPQYRSQNTTVLTMGTPKKVPLILGNPYLGFEDLGSSRYGLSGGPWQLPNCEGGFPPKIYRFPNIKGTVLGFPIIRTIVFRGLYWGPPI